MAFPKKYAALSDQEVVLNIQKARETLGSSLTILGHHYQRDEVIQFADYRGDSLALSRRAAEAKEARYIVFCGVYFMAETAAILCTPEQTVIQPVAEALCPMAQMARAADVAEAWEALTSVWGDDLVPITYQNSIAEVKAFVGRHGGAVCTSSNAPKLFEWALAQKGHLLFMPDEHLGTNSALSLGIPEEEIGIWDPADPPDPKELAHCKVVVWKGFCYVHEGFSVQDVQRVRKRYPQAKLVVHPECPRQVVELADSWGSTAGIIKEVDAAPEKATVAIGTEWHLVHRLQEENPEKLIVPLSRRTCAAMGMTSMRDLLYVLDQILQGDPVNVVKVDSEVAHWARLALERMLQVS
ncbi:MAG: quinolinate synthase NadA [Anaerolineae bacterium]|nr:quinolinate synthase NadA [Anaerolineae bacterium]